MYWFLTQGHRGFMIKTSNVAPSSKLCLIMSVDKLMYCILVVQLILSNESDAFEFLRLLLSPTTNTTQQMLITATVLDHLYPYTAVCWSFHCFNTVGAPGSVTDVITGTPSMNTATSNVVLFHYIKLRRSFVWSNLWLKCSPQKLPQK